ERNRARVRIRCENGWSAWVDGDVLVAVGDTSAVWVKIENAFATMRQLRADFEAGRIDEQTYRNRTLEAGLIVHDGGAWMLDLVNGCLHRYDGFQLRT